MDAILGLLGLGAVIGGVALFIWWFDRAVGGHGSSDSSGPGGAESQ